MQTQKSLDEFKNEPFTDFSKEENAVAMPMASLIRDRFLAALAQDMGELDWSAISKLSAKDTGL